MQIVESEGRIGGDPKFRELEPDGALALPDRRSSNRSVKSRDDRADFP
jgi:hypothetical protein